MRLLGIAPLSQYSLRGRLFVFLLVPFLILLSVTIYTDYEEGLQVVNDAYDHALHNSALALSALVSRDAVNQSLKLPPQAETILRIGIEDQFYYAVTDENGNLLVGDKRLIPLARSGNPDDDNPAYRSVVLNRQVIRAVIYRPQPSHDISAPDNIIIVIAENTRKREAAAAKIITTTLITDLVFIFVSLVVVLVGAHYAHRPLRRISRQIAARASDDLSPIDESSEPLEIHALIHAMNRLMSNLRDASIAQQHFLSTAAHQLRSPLAALQTQMDLAAEALQGEALQRLRDMQASANRLARLTKQMLALARAAPDANLNSKSQRVALNELLENAASEFIDQAVLARIDLGFEIAPAEVWGMTWFLHEMLANLIDNAVRYTGAGGTITVRCGIGKSGNPYLEVEDNGPGIPETLRASALNRFVRLNDMSEGSGLGLAIVKEVAQAHHAHVVLLSGAEGRGLCARVVFPSQT
ncbi:MAG: sensor histidine kinase N-terminal domain-containing protein [Betaproteobacteria bacterium]|nr:sensor histidine kinase N-terminal domain-containing protein [Betaproteobacteria bacterium]